MTPSPVPPQDAQQGAALPLVALILAVVGLCVWPLLPVAFVLAIVSLVKGSEPAYAQRKALAIIALIVPLLSVPLVGIMAAIAIPNFIKFQARSKQSECKANLRGAYAAARSAEGEGTLTADFKAIGFVPDRTRYLYTFGPGHELPPSMPGVPGAGLAAAIPSELSTDLGVHDDHFTIACAGNVDNDADVDVWSISSVERVVNGEPVAAGVVAHHVDDLL